ncbi:hypothetical protein R5H30_21490 [Sulfitobacter sp. D35]|uniref:hypothetical protein n=1 Tax=Sulfitobacter sp. D35 TaxID=3083252 RepID=UPI00296E7D57|nr:hypothetical protein [Sulfitobacter sp. D35]MDW4500571.1 hypothetical protein [Sulfitobacter sp. D35]
MLERSTIGLLRTMVETQSLDRRVASILASANNLQSAALGLSIVLMISGYEAVGKAIMRIGYREPAYTPDLPTKEDFLSQIDRVAKMASIEERKWWALLIREVWREENLLLEAALYDAMETRCAS